MFSSSTKPVPQSSCNPLQPPSHSPEHNSRPFVQLSKSPAWKRSVYICTLAAISVLVLNTLFLIISIIRFGTTGGVGTLYTGQCSTVSRLDSGVHVLINVFSTILLGASNYAMQCLNAPTRRQVDEAHGKGGWVHVGIQSFRNVNVVGAKQGWLWFMLGVSAVPLHLFWNSAIFTTLQANQYQVLIASSDFETAGGVNCVSGATNCTLANSLQSSVKASVGFEYLSNADCMKAYSVPFLTGRRNLIAVTNAAPSTSQVNATIFGNLDSSAWLENMVSHTWLPQSWICSENAEWSVDTGQTVICNTALAEAEAGNWKLPTSLGNPTTSYLVDHCLSELVPEKCQLQFIVAIMIIVIVCNLTKVACMAFTVSALKSAPLMVTGDAVASFMESPDERTKGHCLMGAYPRKDYPLSNDMRSKIWQAKKYRWFSATTRGSWLRCVGLCSIALCISGLLLRQGIINLVQVGTTFSSLSFGAVSPLALVILIGNGSLNVASTSSSVLMAVIIVANLPQIIFSFLYFMYNRLYTGMLAMYEWDQFGLRRRSLRVSHPSGSQRSTYWLSLPYRYSVPLLVASSVMHWFVSQAIFLVRVAIFDYTGQPFYNGGGPSDTNSWSGGSMLSLPGYSPKAILACIVLGVLMVVALIGTGLRRYKSGIPLMGNNSLAISAACHAVEGDGDAAHGLLQWGAVLNGEVEGVGHCCFTTHEIEVPVIGRRYA